MNYAPKGKANAICKKGEFRVAVVGLEHGHIFGMCNGLEEAGAEIASVYDPDPHKVAAFCRAYPRVRVVRSEEEILCDRTVHMIASAAIPSDRAPLGLRAMEHGKDYF